MSRRLFHLKSMILSLCLFALPLNAAVDFRSLEQATPGDQYRQLSLLMLVASGVEPALLEVLDTLPAPADGGMSLSLDDYVTPLVRIVDQETMLVNARRMIHFARQNSEVIQQRMRELARQHPILISMVDIDEITSDAIIIRNAIADSMEYTDFPDAPTADPAIQRFRNQTIYLRNMMEYNQFERELAQITDQAILDLGGRLDAYQRMFEDDVDPDLINRRIESAEIMNAQVGDRFDDQAMMRNSELLMMLILMESQVH